jgi:hypothetical protein
MLLERLYRLGVGGRLISQICECWVSRNQVREAEGDRGYSENNEYHRPNPASKEPDDAMATRERLDLGHCDAGGWGIRRRHSQLVCQVSSQTRRSANPS